LNSTDFSSLNLRPELLENLSTLDFHTMTQVQAQALPLILAGRDVIAQAKTGSGKTAAFALGLLQNLDVKRFRVQALVLCPTRELADQVGQEIRRLARAVHNIKVLTLCGGAPFGPQLGSLEHGAHIVVGTPGRIEEHLVKGSLKLEDINTFVLDEADRMLDMGFQPALDAIVGYLPARRQNLLFSATFAPTIRAIAARLMNDPHTVELESTHDQTSIAQRFYRVDSDTQSRLAALRLLLVTRRPDSTLVFCNTKIETQEIADELKRHGFSALALHGDLEQKVRDQTLVLFANKSASILVATDVAARGLDIDAVDLVINYQIARETEVHVHRIGRTGRAGSLGEAFTLVSEKERFKLERLGELLNQNLNLENLPSAAQLNQPGFKPPMATLQIDAGKKQKLRPGDIVGALTGEGGLAADDIGKITVGEHTAYVAVKRNIASDALSRITNGKLKGKNFRARLL
jgi:ATP-independent RNA helicase DbpA